MSQFNPTTLDRRATLPTLNRCRLDARTISLTQGSNTEHFVRLRAQEDVPLTWNEPSAAAAQMQVTSTGSSRIGRAVLHAPGIHLPGPRRRGCCGRR